MPPGRAKFDDEKSAAMLARRFAGGEKAAQSAAALGMHCRSSETGATGCASPALSSQAPRVKRKQRSDREEEGWQELLSREDKATKQRYAGDPGFSVYEGAACLRRGLLDRGAAAFSAPSRARYDSRPSLTGRRHVASTGEHHPARLETVSRGYRLCLTFRWTS